MHPYALAGCGLKNKNMGACRPSPVTPQLAAATTQPVPPGDSCAAGSPAGTGVLLLSLTVLPATSLRVLGRIFQGRASSVGWLTKGKHHGTEQERMCQRWRVPSDSCAKAERGHRWRFGGLLQTFLCCSPCGLHQHPHHGHRGRVAPRCGVHVSVDGVLVLIHVHGPFLCFGHKGCCTSSFCAASAESPPLQVFWGKKHRQHLGFGWVAPSRSPSAFPELARVFPTINSFRISFLTLILICVFGSGGN